MCREDSGKYSGGSYRDCKIHLTDEKGESLRVIHPQRPYLGLQSPHSSLPFFTQSCEFPTILQTLPSSILDPESSSSGSSSTTGLGTVGTSVVWSCRDGWILETNKQWDRESPFMGSPNSARLCIIFGSRRDAKLHPQRGKWAQRGCEGGTTLGGYKAQALFIWVEREHTAFKGGNPKEAPTTPTPWLLALTPNQDGHQENEEDKRDKKLQETEAESATTLCISGRSRAEGPVSWSPR